MSSPSSSVDIMWEGIRNFFLWPFDHSNSIAVAGWGFWSSIGGVALSIVGFYLTLKQLRRTKKAVDAAKDEASRIKRNFDLYDAAGQAVKASDELDRVKKLYKNRDWRGSVDSYEQVRRCLLSIKLNYEDISEQSVNKINKCLRSIEKYCDAIEISLAAAEDPETDAGKTTRILRSHTELIEEVAAEIRRSSTK